MIAAPVQLRCHRCLTSLLVYQCCLRSTAAARSSPPAVSFSRKDLALMSLHDRHHSVWGGHSPDRFCCYSFCPLQKHVGYHHYHWSVLRHSYGWHPYGLPFLRSPTVAPDTDSSHLADTGI
uniref:Putative secreted protein n=1 Tax=Anopheles darlingi TaxID=43151 RepID=A0A2M4D2W9_ANODA